MKKDFENQTSLLLFSQDLINKRFENQTGSFEVSLENQTSHLKESFDWLYPNIKGINVVHKQIEGKIAPCFLNRPCSLIRYLRVLKYSHHSVIRPVR